MRTSSISSEEFIDYEDLSTEMISQLSSPTCNDPLSTTPSVVDDVSTTLQDSPNYTTGNESNRPLEAIESFLPILQLLPGLELIDNTYYHRGVVLKADMQNLCTYARSIGEFTLTDNIKEKGHSIHSGTVLRLQQLHSRFANGPLLPSLRQLRIVGAKSSLDYLNLFLTPSLRSLEINNVEEAQQIHLSVFLDNLLEEVPDLTQITLGPGRVAYKSLQTCFKFTHLSRLEVFDAFPSFEYDFLEKIGTLPQLETLILNARTSLYNCTAPLAIQDVPLTNNRSEELFGVPPSPVCLPNASIFGTQVAPISSEHGWGWGHPPCVPSPCEAPWPEPSSCKRETSEDEYPRALPPMFPKESRPKELPRAPLSPSIIRSASPCPSVYPRSPSPADSEKSSINEIPRGSFSEPTGPPPVELPQTPEIWNGFAKLNKLQVVGSFALINDLLSLVTSEEIKDLALTLVWTPTLPTVQTPRPSPKILKKGKKRAPSPVKEPAILPVHEPPVSESFVAVVDNACSKWTKTLTTVFIGRESNGGDLGTSNKYDIPVLPTATFESLLFSRYLERLEIGGWNLNTISESIQGLSQVAPSKLKVLHLPIDNTIAGISLTRLRVIAEACPELVSLRCNIKHMSNIPEYPTRIPATDALSHGLEVLSVGNPNAYPDPQRLLLIARHLNILFPRLKKIETHPGHNAEQWKYVGDLAELCQNACLDETKRSNFSA